MDRLDLDILKALLVNNGTLPGTHVLRKSFRQLAKDLAVDQGTIRARLRRFQQQRILRGWYLGASPGLTSQDLILAWLEVEPKSKAKLIERLLSAPDVERVCEYLGGKLSLVMFCNRGTDPDSALRGIAETAASHVSLRMQAVIRPAPHPLKETDSAIVEILRRDPWKPYPAVAKELGLSSRTVKRRVTKLGGEVYMLPLIDLKAVHGIVPAELVVEYSAPESKADVNRSISERVKEYLVFSDVSGPRGYFALAVPNVSQVEQIADWVSGLKGVRGARSEVLIDVILNRRHYEPWRKEPLEERVVSRGRALPLSMNSIRRRG